MASSGKQAWSQVLPKCAHDWTQLRIIHSTFNYRHSYDWTQLCIIHSTFNYKHSYRIHTHTHQRVQHKTSCGSHASVSLVGIQYSWGGCTSCVHTYAHCVNTKLYSFIHEDMHVWQRYSGNHSYWEHFWIDVMTMTSGKCSKSYSHARWDLTVQLPFIHVEAFPPAMVQGLQCSFHMQRDKKGC